MNKYYFTLGQAHRHILPDGSVWDKDGVVEVVALNSEEARDCIFKNFGGAWGMMYEANKLELAFFPKGIVWTYEVGKEVSDVV